MYKFVDIKATVGIQHFESAIINDVDAKSISTYKRICIQPNTHTIECVNVINQCFLSYNLLLSLSPHSQDSDENLNMTSPPRKRERAPSIPRNAEELASHVIHGSLRLTPSRQQILSYSGIRLEERVSALQQQEQEEKQQQEQQQCQRIASDSNLLQSQVAAVTPSQSHATQDDVETQQPMVGSPYSKNSEGSDHCEIEREGGRSNKEKERGGVVESQEKSESDSLARRGRTHNTKVSLRIGKKRRYPSASIKPSKSDSYVTKIKKKARKIRKGCRQRKGLSEPNLIQRTSRGQRTLQRRERTMTSSGAYTSASEFENDHPPVNGITNSNSNRNGDGSVFESNRTHRRTSNSSSVYETPNEGYTSEERLLRSSVSDSSSRFDRDRSDSRAAIPSASSTDDLTALPLKGGGDRRRKGRKRKKSSSSERGGIKKSRLASESSDGGVNRARSTINGLVNGGDFDIKPMDLVWAKCRGYPSYPALVSQ